MRGCEASRRLRTRGREVDPRRTVAAHRQDGAGRGAQDLLGDAARDEVRQPGSSVRSHDDQVKPASLCVFQNRRRRTSDVGHRVDVTPVSRCGRIHALADDTQLPFGPDLRDIVHVGGGTRAPANRAVETGTLRIETREGCTSLSSARLLLNPTSRAQLWRFSGNPSQPLRNIPQRH